MDIITQFVITFLGTVASITGVGLFVFNGSKKLIKEIADISHEIADISRLQTQTLDRIATTQTLQTQTLDRIAATQTLQTQTLDRIAATQTLQTQTLDRIAATQSLQRETLNEIPRILERMEQRAEERHWEIMKAA